VVLVVIVLGLVVGAFAIGYQVGSHADDARVPDLLGLGTERGGQGEARVILNRAGLRVGKVTWSSCTPDEVGLVVHQDPPGGAVTPEGSTVNISIGTTGFGVGVGGGPCLPGEQEPANHPAT
jgi:beta-lactam-binding protein with PASTA domain